MYRLILALFLITTPVQAQCERDFDPQAEGLRPDQVASLIDSQGRCTLDIVDEPYSDGLYGREPDGKAFWEGSPFSKRWLVDYPGENWLVTSERDHLNLRRGSVAYHGPSGTYVFFDRYGQATFLALHVARDQYALFDARTDERVGVIYTADPPKPFRWDGRMYRAYPFVYEYPYFD